MNSPVDHLIDILRKHQELHSTLLEQEERKRQVIIENDIDLLAEINQRQEEVMNLVNKQESDRETIMAMIRAEYDLPEGIKIVELADFLPEVGEELLAVRNELQETLVELKYRSDQNSDLLRISVDHIKDFFATVNEARTLNPTYNRGGGASGSQVRFLDQTA